MWGNPVHSITVSAPSLSVMESTASTRSSGRGCSDRSIVSAWQKDRAILSRKGDLSIAIILDAPQHPRHQGVAHPEGAHALHHDGVCGGVALLRVRVLERPPEGAVGDRHLLGEDRDLVRHPPGDPEHERPREHEHLLAHPAEEVRRVLAADDVAVAPVVQAPREAVVVPAVVASPADDVGGDARILPLVEKLLAEVR